MDNTIGQPDYQYKIDFLDGEIRKILKRLNWYSFLRLAIFVSVLIAMLLLGQGEVVDIGLKALIFIGVALFLFIMQQQSKVDLLLDAKRRLKRIFANELSCLEGGVNMYGNGGGLNLAEHPFADDLDLLGDGSLFQKINRCRTHEAKVLLRSRLLEKTTAEQIIFRQQAIKELGGMLESTFYFRALLINTNEDGLKKVTDQIKRPLSKKLNYLCSKGVTLYLSALPFLTGGIIILSFFDIFFLMILAVLFLLNLFWMALTFRVTNKVFFAAAGLHKGIKNYASSVEWFESKNWHAPYLQDLVQPGFAASKDLIKLARITSNFEARLNVLVNILLNGLLAWDVRCCRDFLIWHKGSVGVTSALLQIAEFEELISFATFASHHSEYTFPLIVSKPGFRASELCHPLVIGGVSNDFETVTANGVDIITGSNMAGKSTFLRTIGINLVLAYAGAPVAAKYLETSVYNLVTYMRISDSIVAKKSTFKTEIDRLQLILNIVNGSKTSLVLIDEMLRGTNSKDKLTGSEVFIRRLLNCPCHVLFATHDIQLAQMSGNNNNLRNFHFDAIIEQDEMFFDYKLKQGPCTHFNAIYLLNKLGLLKSPVSSE